MALFRKNKSSPPAAPAGSETAFIGPKLSVKGKVSGSGNLIVMGRVEGEFDLAGELVVAPAAVLEAELRAERMTVSGKVTGNLTARGKIHLEKSAIVGGRMVAERLSIAEGAVFNGEIEMKPAVAAPAAPAPKPPAGPGKKGE